MTRADGRRTQRLSRRPSWAGNRWVWRNDSVTVPGDAEPNRRMVKPVTSSRPGADKRGLRRAAGAAVISGVLWLAVWVHYLAAHGTSNVDQNRTPLGLSWYDTSRILVVSLLLVVYVVGTVRLGHGWVARLSRYGAVVGYLAAALGIVVALGVTDWGSTTLDVTRGGAALIALGTAVGGVSAIVYGREAIRVGLLPRGSGLPLSLGLLTAIPWLQGTMVAFGFGVAWIAIGASLHTSARAGATEVDRQTVG